MVVVGGDAAGMSAASQARRRRGADDLEIVAFERGGHTSYSACGLPYYAGDVVKDWRRLVAAPRPSSPSGTSTPAPGTRWRQSI
jgi:NADPH-dependent 2,4-dienoyl-CoA reductase/sulfur reductase-like enzyme